MLIVTIPLPKIGVRGENTANESIRVWEHQHRESHGTEDDAKHCNSCLLIISASISGSKPPANADRTLSLSRSPHFVSLPSRDHHCYCCFIPFPALYPMRFCYPYDVATRLFVYVRAVARTRETSPGWAGDNVAEASYELSIPSII